MSESVHGIVSFASDGTATITATRDSLVDLGLTLSSGEDAFIEVIPVGAIPEHGVAAHAMRVQVESDPGVAISRDAGDLVLRGHPEALGILGLAYASGSPQGASQGGPALPMAPYAGWLVFALVAWIVGSADVRAIRRPEPETVQRAVKTGVFSLVWLNVGVVAALRGPGLALAVALLWFPAFFLGRWLYST